MSSAAAPPHTLCFLSPGHFHAALTLRERHPRVRDEVHVYAEEGAELAAFLELVASFNARAERPTRWRPTVHAGPAPLERLIAARRGDVVIIAGRNDTKMAAIARLHGEGFHVLADKPWVVHSSALEALERATAAPPHVMDLMTGRFDPTHLIPARLTADAALFGEFQGEGDPPAIQLATVHHLYKEVNGHPLVRPAWYFDAAVQGDGVVDIPSHLVDKALRMIPGPPVEFGRELLLGSARLWPTAVPGEAFTRVTGEAAYPESLAKDMREGVLHVACNGEFEFSVRGVSCRVRGEWRLQAPPGGGDTYGFVLRGTRAVVAVEMGAETDFRPEVFVRPRDAGADLEPLLRVRLEDLGGEFPGLGLAQAGAKGWRVEIPAALRTPHESHFPLVLDDFLQCLDHGSWPPGHSEMLRAKYTLTARASELAWVGYAPPG